MSDDRQPSYDFFTPTRPATPPDQRSAPPSELEPGRDPNSPYPGSPPGPLRDVVPGNMPFAAQIPPARSGIPTVVVVLLVVVGSLVGLGILAAVAVPVFLSQRLKADYAATTVSLPAAFNGVERNTGPEATQLAKSFAMDDIRAEDVAIYGPLGQDVVIILAVKPPAGMNELEQQRQRNDFESSFSAQGTPIALQGGPTSGDLRGWAGCATTTQKLDVCLATSTGSLVAVLSSAADDPTVLMRQARAATVHHS